MTDPDQILNQYEGKLAEAQRKSDALRESLVNLRVMERSADGQIVVTVNDAGNLVDLKLGNALQRRDGDSVAQAAQSRVAATVQEAMSPMLGADSEAMHFMMDKLRSVQPPPPPQYVPGGGGYGGGQPRLGAIEDDAPPPPLPAPPVPPPPLPAPPVPPRPQRPRPPQDGDDDFSDRGFLR
ncbi:YbaB/EbfC family nucleoid-associated protein [Lentzea nigeriaca]|uniref:YbaB/EbfC family nucleoid-associated protein n=1 Tax=Lentzea nigeriaca TaxID=1128665 RepID=UPI0019565EBF|nr:YbaB/EbfC family nucleoid-associated protein [Lentzea nigeriaca]MBM7860758.1 DNA-binding protein YbaB [Lentzea nigeriaca]